MSLLYSVSSLEGWGLNDTLVAAGDYTLVINGTKSPTGVLAGTITIAQALPEPATWAMMIIGFGAVGFTLRRKRNSLPIAQAA